MVGTGSRAIKLTKVDIDFRTPNYVTARQGHPIMQASDDLHRLFGEAIRLAILGSTEEDAMAGFMTAWKGKYARWQIYLGYGGTIW